VLQSDGKIVDAGATNGELVVTRLNANRTPDNSFGTAGAVTTNLAGLTITAVSAVVVNPAGGQILVAGSASACTKCVTDTVLARYHADGSLDQTFGNDGTIAVNAIEAPGAVALLLDNGILTVQGDAIVEFGLVREIVFLFGRSWPPTLVQANGFRACGRGRAASKTAEALISLGVVGEGVRSCPRAQCGKSACCVRSSHTRQDPTGGSCSGRAR
jgi:uncharacterized delta-60 repeat protein